MNIGRRVDYAVRALTYLAAQPQERVVPRREIQAKQDIPAHFLSKIMKQLALGGLVESYMGARGGFTLKKPASDISLRAVYECLEGPLLLMECLDEDGNACCYHPVCNQISVWGEANACWDRIWLMSPSDKSHTGWGCERSLPIASGESIQNLLVPILLDRRSEDGLLSNSENGCLGGPC